MSTDTLRYYGKIGLLLRALRDSGGRRRCGNADLARLLFIQRAQAMNFSLAGIGNLLHPREHLWQTRADVRRMAGQLGFLLQSIVVDQSVVAEHTRDSERERVVYDWQH
ncbi:MAG: MerR family transcriptional regulator [Rhodanobacter sp.]|nr:MAG: MerR family transcriptional regulator [Rhodanobacter sp.]TAM03781.1 MAG: MerR family transcriptional regulator [Rhodanobacter sp.]TAM40951.1 MAG: MerR family transcriptional regulator [Rhodanobacter sp.]